MIRHHCGWAIPLALLLGVGTAAAAPAGSSANMQNMPNVAGGMAATTGTTSPENQLGLTRPQMQRIYQSVATGKTQAAPSGFQATIGAQAPSSLRLHKLPNRVADRIPAVSHDRYAVLRNGDLVLVNKNHKVDEVITHGEGQVAP
jgi:hypothetical protein